MSDYLTTMEMLTALEGLELLPYEYGEASRLVPDDGGFDGGFGIRFHAEPGLKSGLAYIYFIPTGREVLVVKSLRKRGIFGGAKPKYTLMMSFEGGETWEEGPTVAMPWEMTDLLRDMLLAHKRLETTLG